LHIPKLKQPPNVWPIVLAFHGGGTSAEVMVEFSGLNEKSDAAGFVAVYPNGTGRFPRALTFNGGNCCGRAMIDNVDDVKFTRALLDDLEHAVAVDRNRVFATGMSNGAIMCYLLASAMSDRIAAIAPVSGPMGTDTCSPARPVSVCHFHGTNDQFAPYAGGIGARSLTRTNFHSAESSIHAWVLANGCSPKPQAERLPDRLDDGTHVVRSIYGGGKDGSEVVLYTIEGGGHTWPGRSSTFKMLGPTTQNVSANDVMWEFFQRHANK
jgi:polyhydroxybutyrate depolymerase